MHCRVQCSIAGALRLCLTEQKKQSAVLAQLTLALLPPGPHLFWQCFFAVLGAVIASTVRVATDMGTGIVTGVPLRDFLPIAPVPVCTCLCLAALTKYA